MFIREYSWANFAVNLLAHICIAAEENKLPLLKQTNKTVALPFIEIDIKTPSINKKFLKKLFNHLSKIFNSLDLNNPDLIKPFPYGVGKIGETYDFPLSWECVVNGENKIMQFQCRLAQKPALNKYILTIYQPRLNAKTLNTN